LKRFSSQEEPRRDQGEALDPRRAGSNFNLDGQCAGAGMRQCSGWTTTRRQTS